MRKRQGACVLALLLAPIVIAAAERSPIDDRDAPVEIDFAACEPATERIFSAFGSTTYEILGVGPVGCVMRYGGEVENRTWDGFLDHACVVPVARGLLRFERTSTGVDFTPLDADCAQAPERG